MIYLLLKIFLIIINPKLKILLETNKHINYNGIRCFISQLLGGRKFVRYIKIVITKIRKSTTQTLDLLKSSIYTLREIYWTIK